MACALAAAQRTAANLNLRRGRFALGAISDTAPLLGTLLTVRLIIGSFRGTTGERTSIWIRLMWDLSESLYPFVIALGLSLFAAWLKHWIDHRASGMEQDARRALGAMDLILRHWDPAPGSTSGKAHHA